MCTRSPYISNDDSLFSQMPTSLIDDDDPKRLVRVNNKNSICGEIFNSPSNKRKYFDWIESEEHVTKKNVVNEVHLG